MGVESLLWLNLLLPVILGVQFAHERRISQIEGYMRGHANGKNKQRKGDKN